MGIDTGKMIDGRYRLEQRLGHGSSALTFRAHDLESKTDVLLKLLPISQLEAWKHYELFEREAATLAHLDHPSIPRLQRSFRLEQGDSPCCGLVMDFIPGESLQQRLEAGWRPDEPALRALAAQLLAILVYLHSLHPPVVHRDLKPANLIYAPDGRLWLVDFGAVQAALRPRGGSTVVGTFGYMAPEQFAGKALPASDLYGLGATLAHLATGTAPHDMELDEIRLDFWPHYHGSRAFGDWLAGLLAPGLKQRFASAEAALEALTEPTVQLAVAALTESRLPARRNPALAYVPASPHRPAKLSAQFPLIEHRSGCLSVDFPTPTTEMPLQLAAGMMLFSLLSLAACYGSLIHTLMTLVLHQKLTSTYLFAVFCLPLLHRQAYSVWKNQRNYRIVLRPERFTVETRFGRQLLWRRSYANRHASVSAEEGHVELRVTRRYTVQTVYKLGRALSDEEAASVRAEIDCVLADRADHFDAGPAASQISQGSNLITGL